MSIILLLILLVLYLNFRVASLDWRLAAVSAAVVFGVLVVIVTETLSVFHLLTRTASLVCWGVVLVVAVVLWWVRGGRPALPRFRVTPVGLGIVAVIAVIGVIAWMAPPNSTDAMTYHMARVWMWEQYGTLAHYPVFDTRHLYNPPLTEFIQLHIFLLDNGDNATNLVQWVALMLGVVAAPYAAAQFGAGPRGQMLASAFTVSIPIGVQQASGAKNDLLVAVWILCVLVYTSLLLQRHDGPQMRWYVLGLAGSVALATFTKPTGYLFSLPILLWLGLVWLLRGRWRIFAVAAVVAVSILAVNGPHFVRNYSSFGNPISDTSDSSNITVDQVSLKGTVSIATRNVLVNTPLPPSVTPFIYRNLEQLHEWMGIDLNAGTTTFEDRQFRFIEWQDAFVESRTPNPLHLGLIVVAYGIMLVRARHMPRVFFVLAAVVLLQSLLFPMLIAWQTWSSRLQLSIFLTGGVLVGIVFERGLPEWVLRAVAVVMMVGAVPWLVNGRPRSFITVERTKTVAMTSVPREQIYFLREPDLYQPYVGLMAYLDTAEGCSSVGIYTEVQWQYPLLHGLEHTIPGVRVQYLDAVEPLVSLYERSPFADFEPCMVIDATHGSDDVLRYDVDGQPFYRMWRTEPYSVYQPAGFVDSPYANVPHTVQAFPQVGERSFHVYSDCVEVTCRLVTVIELDWLGPEVETVTFEADDGWRADVTYVDQTEDELERYRVAVYDADGDLMDDGMRLLVGDDIVTWEGPSD